MGLIGLLYALTLLLNALLLFLVQPMIAKLLLPYLGGTPAVWNTCMVFFQIMLLGGYGYSHFVTQKLALKPQIIAHLALFVGAALIFPFEISEASLHSLGNGAQPIGWMLRQLFAMVGLPFLMLATSGPLLQQWFSQTDHPAAQDPYFLYSASNVGSLAALLGYPLLVEPLLRLRQQSLLWAVGYGALLLLLGVCAGVRWRAGHSTKAETGSAESLPESPPLAWPQRGRWVLLSFVPSSLMLGVTAHLSTDISPFPLLWVVPLALYLLTFILAFAKRQLMTTARLAQILPLLGIALIVASLAGRKVPGLLAMSIGLPLLFFFCAAWLCHRQLAETRPATRHLTEFYVWLSVGGMLGGLFNSLLAPFIFSRVLEYPLMVVIALLLRPRASAKPLRPLWERSLDFALPAALGLLTFFLKFSLPLVGLPKMPALTLTLGLPAVIGLSLIAKPIRFSLAMAAILLSSTSLAGLLFKQDLHLSRNFFGVQRVILDKTGVLHELGHGNTIHGRQFIDPRRQCEPLSYYHQNGPIGELMAAFAALPGNNQTAIVGLGAGALATYAKPGEAWTYFEIDPGVIHVAVETGHFTYLKNCSRAPYQIVQGDARLQLRKFPDQQFGLIVLDAFSSDAVPTHLLTKEAVELYLAKLAVGGRLAVHISNNYLDLRPVIAGLAQHAKLACFINDDLTAQMTNRGDFQDPAWWAVLARREEDLGSLRQHPRWHRLTARADHKLWTDDYSNILSVFKRK